MELYKKRISDLGRIVTGKTPRTSNAHNYGGDIPFLTPSDDLSGKFAPKTVKTITETGLSEVKNCLLPSKSVCVSCIGSDLGKVVITNEPTVTNQQFNSIIPTNENDTDFIYYLMTIVGKHLNFLSKTSTAVPIINKSTFSDYEIEVPSLENQRRIVKVLSSLDDKIEVNKRINDNLEQQAQALFKSWFVDFEPFHDKPFVESEFGMIPEGWRVGTIGDIICEVESGSRPKGGAEIDGIPSIGAEKIERIGYYDYSGEKYVNSEYYAKMKRGHVKDGDVLLYKDGAYTGKSSMALDGFPYNECAVNEHVFLLRTEASKYQFYLYCLVSYPDIRTTLYTLASSKAAQPGLNQKELLGVKIILPNEYTIQQFNRIIAANMHKIATNAKQSHNLSQIRDTLLPRLMSGELEVKDIENSL